MTKIIYLITRLLLILVLFSYFIGLIWYLYVNCVEQFVRDVEKNFKGDEKISFIAENSLEKEDPWTITIIVVYFALTTMSSVGLGDYHP